MVPIRNDAVPHRGTVIEKSGSGVTIKIAANLGQITIPFRMVVSDHPVQVGDEVHFSMSLFEIFN